MIPSNFLCRRIWSFPHVLLPPSLSPPPTYFNAVSCLLLIRLMLLLDAVTSFVHILLASLICFLNPSSSPTALFNPHLSIVSLFSLLQFHPCKLTHLQWVDTPLNCTLSLERSTPGSGAEDPAAPAPLPLLCPPLIHNPGLPPHLAPQLSSAPRTSLPKLLPSALQGSWLPRPPMMTMMMTLDFATALPSPLPSAYSANVRTNNYNSFTSRVNRSPSPALGRNIVENNSTVRSTSVGRPSVSVRSTPMMPPTRGSLKTPVVIPHVDPPSTRFGNRGFSASGNEKPQDFGNLKEASALRDEVDMLQEENEVIMEKLRQAEERKEQAEARARELEKQVASLGEGVSLEAKLLSRKEAAMRQREVFCWE